MEVASAPAAAVEAGLDRVSGLNGGESGVVESAAVESRVEKRRNKGTAWSAWRKPAPPPAADTGVAAGEGRKTEGPVMGAESWPALKDAMPKDHPDSMLKQAPAPTVSSAAPNVGDAADNVPLHPRPLPSQGSGGLPKSDGFGNSNPSSRHHTQHHHKLGPKHAPSPNNITPFPTHLTYHQPIPPLLPPIVPGPPLPVHESGYQPYPPPFPSVEPRMVSSGCGTPMQAFIPPIPPRGVDANRSFPPHPRGDPNVWHNHGGNYSRRHNAQESTCRFNPSWRQQQVFGPRENVNMQQNIGPKTFVRPVQPVFGPAPGYMGGPGFPGPAPMYYVPFLSEVVRGPPHYMSVNPSHPGHPILRPKAITLRNGIIAQIEYYFSDENLQKDSYLLSLLDSEGWVPVAKIADFNRVKNMTTSIPFILEALQSSNLIEVQGEKIRRHGDWSKWLSLPGHQASTAKPQASKVQVNNIADDMESNDSSGKGERGLLKINEDEGIKGQLIDASNIELKSTSGCIVGELLTPDRSKEYSQETRDSNGKSVYASSSESKGTETGDGCNRMPAHQSASKKFGGLSNAFANEPSNSSEQSTFMLDEELDFDHSSIQRDAMSSQKSHAYGKRPRVESQQDDDPWPTTRPRFGEESPTLVDVSTPPESRATASFSPCPGDVFTEAGLEVDESIPDISLDIEGLDPPTDDYTPVTNASPMLDTGGTSATQGLENPEVRPTLPVVEEGGESSADKGTSSSSDSSSGGSSNTSSSTGTSGTSSNGDSSSSSSSTSEEGEIRMSPVARSTSSLDELSRLMELGPSADLSDYDEDVRAPNTGIGVPNGLTPPLAVGPLAGTVGVVESNGMQGSEGRSTLQPEGVDMTAGSPQAPLEEQDTTDQGVASAEPLILAISPSAEPTTEVDTVAIGEETRVEIEGSAAPVSSTKQGSVQIDISPPVLEEGSSFRSNPTSKVTLGLAEGGADVPQDFPAFGVEWPDTPQPGVVLADADTAGRLLQGLEQLILVDPLPTVEALRGNLEAFTRSYQMLGLPKDAWAVRLTTLWSKFTRLHITQEQRQRTQLMIQQEEEQLDRLRAARMEVEAQATAVRERDQAVSLRVEVLQREMQALLQQTHDAEEERSRLQAEAETLRCRLEGLQEETIQSEARLADLRRSECSA